MTMSGFANYTSPICPVLKTTRQTRTPFLTFAGQVALIVPILIERRVGVR